MITKYYRLGFVALFILSVVAGTFFYVKNLNNKISSLKEEKIQLELDIKMKDARLQERDEFIQTQNKLLIEQQNRFNQIQRDISERLSEIRSVDFDQIAVDDPSQYEIEVNRQLNESFRRFLNVEQNQNNTTN